MNRIFNSFRRETDEGAMDRLLAAMLMNQFHKLNMGEDGIKAIADRFFDDFEGCKGITISRESFIERTTERLLRIEKEIQKQESENKLM